MNTRRSFIVSTVVLSSFGLASRIRKSLTSKIDKTALMEETGSKTYYHPRWRDPQEVSFKDVELNVDSTFGTYVVASNNKFAYNACFSFAESCLNFSYFPLFIQGAQGMGSTHLLHAIGNHVSNNSKLNVRLVSGERFINEVVMCIRRGEMGKLRHRYRNDCDLLLIDDIQVIARGSAVQEELFHLLVEREDLGLPVVMTSDLMPRNIEGLDRRIRDRIDGGLVVNILSPNLETRTSILKYKSERRGVSLDDETAEFISHLADQSIRQLEGYLNKLVMYSNIYDVPISLQLAKRVLV